MIELIDEKFTKKYYYAIVLDGDLKDGKLKVKYLLDNYYTNDTDNWRRRGILPVLQVQSDVNNELLEKYFNMYNSNFFHKVEELILYRYLEANKDSYYNSMGGVFSMFDDEIQDKYFLYSDDSGDMETEYNLVKNRLLEYEKKILIIV